MEPVTYSLQGENKNSEEYYKIIRSFTDEVLLKAESTIKVYADDFRSYVTKYELEEVRHLNEYILELISFGILWKTYSATALSIKFAPYMTLINLGIWRKKHQRLKPAIDILRGLLITMFLLPSKTKAVTSPPTLEDVDRGCLWFEATGEFREHALRFVRWRAYWATLQPAKVQKIFNTIAEFRRWFVDRSEEVLGKYTKNVNDFLEKNTNRYKWREDRVSCLRKRNEYFLNMLGAEMLNRAYKNNYDETETTALLLPGCMRALPADKCEAKKEKKGLLCTGCTAECHVNYYRLMGEKKNYSVYVIPHASDLSLWAPEKGKPKCGVIASACVTTLVEGGLELKRYGVPAQCVLLEYSGCKKHWHPTGVETEINRHEVERILQKEISLQ